MPLRGLQFPTRKGQAPGFARHRAGELAKVVNLNRPQERESFGVEFGGRYRTYELHHARRASACGMLRSPWSHGRAVRGNPYRWHLRSVRAEREWDEDCDTNRTTRLVPMRRTTTFSGKHSALVV